MTAADPTTVASSTGARAKGASAALADVSRLLASYPAPQLPRWLEFRLDQALAAEAAIRMAATQAPGPGRGSPRAWPAGRTSTQRGN
jgi:hypothetical protein